CTGVSIHETRDRKATDEIARPFAQKVLQDCPVRVKDDRVVRSHVAVEVNLVIEAVQIEFQKPPVLECKICGFNRLPLAEGCSNNIGCFISRERAKWSVIDDEGYRVGGIPAVGNGVGAKNRRSAGKYGGPIHEHQQERQNQQGNSNQARAEATLE